MSGKKYFLRRRNSKGHLSGPHLKMDHSVYGEINFRLLKRNAET